MGNKKSRLALEDAQPRPQPRAKHRRQNHVARDLLEEHISDRLPTDDEIRLALAAQQSQTTGKLKKADLIAILIRLNPARDNALISQFNVQDLADFIRHELYATPLQAFAQQQYPPTQTAKLEIEEV